MTRFKLKSRSVFLPQLAFLTVASGAWNATAKDPYSRHARMETQAEDTEDFGIVQPGYAPGSLRQMSAYDSSNEVDVQAEQPVCHNLRVWLKRQTRSPFSIRLSLVADDGKKDRDQEVYLGPHQEMQVVDLSNDSDQAPILSLSVKRATLPQHHDQWEFCWATQCVDEQDKTTTTPPLNCEYGPADTKEHKHTIVSTGFATIIDTGGGPPGDVIHPPMELANLRDQIRLAHHPPLFGGTSWTEILQGLSIDKLIPVGPEVNGLELEPGLRPPPEMNNVP